MTQGPRARLLVGAAVLGLLLGCSGTGEEPTPSGTADLPAQGPLEEIVGWAQPVDGTAGMVEQIRLQESQITECMAELGFEYFPAVPAADQIKEMSGPVQGSREYVERYGYGVWNPVSDEAGGFEIEMEPAPEREEYLDSMSSTEREAYDTALWGEVTETFEDGSTARSGGCFGVGHEGAVAEDEFLRAVRDEAIEFLSALPEDPAFADLDDRWSECMAGEGMGYASPHRARASFFDGIDELFEEANREGVDPFQLPAAAERGVEEKRVALADFECRESLDYDRQHTLVAHELQADYVERHRADLDLLAAALGG